MDIKKYTNYNDNLITIGYTKNYPNQINFPKHIHDFYEIYYFISGDVTYNIEGNTYKLRPHDILLINSRELHYPIFNSNELYERLIIHFNPSVLSFIQTEYNLMYCFENRKLGQFNKIDSKDSKQSNLEDYFWNILYYSNQEEDEDRFLGKTFFAQLLLQINKIYKKRKKDKSTSLVYDNKMNSVISYINKNINLDLSLELIGKECFVNKYYLCHMFKKNTGFTVVEYICLKRIALAKELLLEGKSATDVSFESGFQDYSSFYRNFKKVTGLTPRQFVKSGNRLSSKSGLIGH